MYIIHIHLCICIYVIHIHLCIYIIHIHHNYYTFTYCANHPVCIYTLLFSVLKAIADGSSTVPKLMSEYLKSECKLALYLGPLNCEAKMTLHCLYTVLTSPVTDRHSLNDPPVRNHKISTLSV